MHHPFVAFQEARSVLFSRALRRRSPRFSSSNGPWSGTTTRYTTLSVSSQSALRQQAWKRSRNAGGQDGRAAMLFLHLSMLSLIPIVFDSFHGQSAYGYSRNMSTAALSAGSPADSDSAFMPSSKHEHSRQLTSDPSPSSTSSRSPSVSLATTSASPVASSNSSAQHFDVRQDRPSTPQRLLPSPTPSTHDVEIQTPQVSDASQAVEALVAARGAATLPEDGASYSSQPVKQILAVLEQPASLPFGIVEGLMSDSLESHNVHLAVASWLVYRHSRRHAPGGKPYCTAEDAVYMQDSFLQTTKLIPNALALPVHAEGAEEAGAQKAFIEATAGYSNMLSALLRGDILPRSSFVPIFEMMMLVPPPQPPQLPVISSPDQPAIPISSHHIVEHNTSELLSGEILSSPEPPTLDDAVRLYLSAFKLTHSLFRTILEDLLNATAPSTNKCRIVYDSKSKEWYLGQQAADEHQPALPRLTSEVTQVISAHVPTLKLLLRYAYSHLRSWEIGETLYSRVILPALEAAEQKPSTHVLGLQMNDTRQRGAMLQLNTELSLSLIRETLLTEAARQDERDEALMDAEPWRRASYEEAAHIRNREVWGPHILLRSEGLRNHTITATLASWTTAQKFGWLRYYIHYFIEMLRTVRRFASDKRYKSRNRSGDPAEPCPLQLDSMCKRFNQWLSSPEILTCLLNAAVKMGNTSLAESIWNVILEAERDFEWSVPIQAHTLMLQLYGDEARKELVALRNAHESRRRDSSSSDSDSGFESVSSAGRSQIMSEQKRSLKRHDKAAAVDLAWQIYMRFALDTPSNLPDAHFVNAALRVFLGNVPSSLESTAGLESSARRSHTSADISAASDRSLDEAHWRLSVIHRDIITAGLSVPETLRNTAQPVPRGRGLFREQSVFRIERRKMRSLPALIAWMDPDRQRRADTRDRIASTKDRSAKTNLNKLRKLRQSKAAKKALSSLPAQSDGL